MCPKYLERWLAVTQARTRMVYYVCDVNGEVLERHVELPGSRGTLRDLKQRHITSWRFAYKISEEVGSDGKVRIKQFCRMEIRT